MARQEYTQIRVTVEKYQTYDELTKQIVAHRGGNLTVPSLVDEAVTYYIKHLESQGIIKT